MSEILVVGSLHYDIMLDAHHRPEKGETVFGSNCYFKFGGKGGNQAVSLANSKSNVRFLGAVGNDEIANFLLSKLAENSIDIAFVKRLENIPSGMSVAISDCEGDYGAVVCSNANLHIDCKHFDENKLWEGIQMLVLQNEVPEIININAAKAAKSRNLTVCLNAAPAKDLNCELIKLIDVLVVNTIEARDMCGVTVRSLDSALLAASTLLENYSTVVVTAGEYGVSYINRFGECGSIPAKKVKLISTHGAGDCFMGKLCASLNQGYTLTESVELANNTAAEHVSQMQRFFKTNCHYMV